MKTTKNVVDQNQFNRVIYKIQEDHGPIRCIAFSTCGLEYEKDTHTSSQENEVYNVTRNQNGDVFAVARNLNDGTCLVVVTGEKVNVKVKAPKNMGGFFASLGTASKCSNLDVLNVSGLDVSKTENFSSCFRRVGSSSESTPNYTGVKIVGLNQWDTSSAHDMSRMFMDFNNFVKDFSLDLTSFDFKTVVHFDNMFCRCGMNSKRVELKGIEQKEFAFVNTRSFYGMFFNFGACADFCLDLSGWKNQSRTEETALKVLYFAPKTFLKIKKPDWITELV